MADLTLTNLNQTLTEYHLDGIECELRGIQKCCGTGEAALKWWDGNFAHKYPDYRYDAKIERIVKRDGKQPASTYQWQDKQAFDTLYTALQEIGTIVSRAIRDGEKGHKRGLHKIMEICRRVE